MGLFGANGPGSSIRNLGLTNVAVTGNSNSSSSSAIAGLSGVNQGALAAVYVHGVVSDGPSNHDFAGLLTGANIGSITASYAAGSVNSDDTVTDQIGGLAGQTATGSSITASYVVNTTNYGLNGAHRAYQRYGRGTSNDSYWDTDTSGWIRHGGDGKTAEELQSPTGYTGIYANWNVATPGVTGDAGPWRFGAGSDYPYLWWQTAPPPAQPLKTDYDTDDDRLIEINSLAQLDALRYDILGQARSGVPATFTDGLVFPLEGSEFQAYRVAFPDPQGDMGCPLGGCIGYELVTDLDFDTNGSGAADSGDAYWNGGQGWYPIGTWLKGFSATFEGNGHLIKNLYMNIPDNPVRPPVHESYGYTGLFGALQTPITPKPGIAIPSAIRNLGIIDADISVVQEEAGDQSRVEYAGVLAGLIGGEVTAVRVSGDISTTLDNIVGLLAGGWDTGGTVTASYVTGSVTTTKSSGHVGGMLGLPSNNTKITASYSTAVVTGPGSQGLIGTPISGNPETIRAGVVDSYWDTEVSTKTNSVAGTGKTTSELQTPTGYSGIYANWNDLDGVSGEDADLLWRFGSATQYPALSWEARAPGKPDNFSATAGNAQAALAWDAQDSTITSYEYSSDDGANWTPIPSSDSSTVSYTVTTLTNGQAYTLRVRGVNSAGNGDASDSVTVTLQPAAPTGLAATPGHTVVTLTWTNPGNPTITRYEYSVDSGTWTAITGSDASTVTYTVTSLDNGTAYAFRVRTVNATGNGDASASVTATPMESSGPEAPTGVDRRAWQRRGDADLDRPQRH